jgi:hypothetical protein
MPTTNSAQYQKINVSKLPATNLEAQGETVPISFKHVVGAGVNPTIVEASGDTVFLCVIPAGFEVYDMLVMSPDGGFGTATVAIGDAGSATRFSGTAAVLTTGRLVLAPAAARFKPTVDTPVFMTWGAATPTATRTLYGHFNGVPSM